VHQAIGEGRYRGPSAAPAIAPIVVEPSVSLPIITPHAEGERDKKVRGED